MDNALKEEMEYLMFRWYDLREKYLRSWQTDGDYAAYRRKSLEYMEDLRALVITYER